MSDYAEHTTAELVLDLEVGAAVLAREGMHDFPEVLRAAAKRLEKLQGERETVKALLEPIQPNSMGMTSYELGWADCQAKIRAAIHREVSQ